MIQVRKRLPEAVAKDHDTIIIKLLYEKYFFVDSRIIDVREYR